MAMDLSTQFDKKYALVVELDISSSGVKAVELSDFGGAFVELLTKIAELNQKWLGTDAGETGITEPTPRKHYRELMELYMKH